MTQPDTTARSESESGVGTARGVAKSGREYVSKLAPSLRHGVESGAVPTVIGGVGLLGGLRAFVSGERKRGLAGLAVGAAFLAAALAQRRFRILGRESTVEETDVVDTGPDVEAVADEAGGVGEEDHAAGEAAAEVTDTSPDVEDVGSGLESESDTDAESASVDQREVADTGVDSDDLAEATTRETGDAGGTETTSDETTTGAVDTGTGSGAGVETEDVDRLGEAAIDRQSREVPAPQRAFNQGFLAHSAEAFWGIRTGDDEVLVSQDYDAIEGRDGVRYVASSEIGEDVRELPIPDVVLDHWDSVIDGGTAVTGGDSILFVTTDDLAADGLLRVLPAERADDVSG
ncbi:hypothetical protein HUG10_04375 [Halorarum halophilum]|uniref:Uncharacterized protein n=1 Tax=Halorarum halophilum TaxID=2743090 RepID=A0A7D5K0F8_9EURY|nr:hypothetical protein [Halobaculum halophilum]QLG26821.1 hypothetical protein HUG10_04375 [Halobaculum halophilum]